MAAEAPDPGGYGLGGLGPTSEGMAIWIIGIVAIVRRPCGSEHDMTRNRRREDTPKGTDAPGHAGAPGQPSDAELASMSREELVELGGKLDGVEIVYKEDRWPVEGTKAEKRAERSVANWLLLGGLSGLALLLVFLFWPWEYRAGGTDGHWWYDLATPLYGLTFGLSILAIGIGAVLYQKKFIPEEISIQDRHDGAPPRSSARPSRPTSPMRWRARRSSGAS